MQSQAVTARTDDNNDNDGGKDNDNNDNDGGKDNDNNDRGDSDGKRQ